ncbi:hypothetical protein V9T40_014151 [Parthenolecanium corni]|uniref:Uncharacterized protein n=1 Tax=Parthenolecanium corni TaxID=536013 RepID=A0AAN9TG95_9HEMI
MNGCSSRSVLGIGRVLRSFINRENGWATVDFLFFGLSACPPPHQHLHLHLSTRQPISQQKDTIPSILVRLTRSHSLILAHTSRTFLDSHTRTHRTAPHRTAPHSTAAQRIRCHRRNRLPIFVFYSPLSATAQRNVTTTDGGKPPTPAARKRHGCDCDTRLARPQSAPTLSRHGRTLLCPSRRVTSQLIIAPILHANPGPGYNPAPAEREANENSAIPLDSRVKTPNSVGDMSCNSYTRIWNNKQFGLIVSRYSEQRWKIVSRDRVNFIFINERKIIASNADQCRCAAIIEDVLQTTATATATVRRTRADSDDSVPSRGCFALLMLRLEKPALEYAAAATARSSKLSARVQFRQLEFICRDKKYDSDFFTNCFRANRLANHCKGCGTIYLRERYTYRGEEEGEEEEDEEEEEEGEFTG